MANNGDSGLPDALPVIPRPWRPPWPDPGEEKRAQRAGLAEMPSRGYYRGAINEWQPSGTAAAEETLPTVEPYRQRAEEEAATLASKVNPPRAHGWREFGRVMSRIGQGAGMVVAPGVMENIPGTDANRFIQLQHLRGYLSADDERRAQEEEQRARAAYQAGPLSEEAQANAAFRRAEAQEKGLPSLIKPEDWMLDERGNPIPTYNVPHPGGYPGIETYPVGKEPRAFPSSSVAPGAAAAGPTGTPPGAMPTIPQAAAPPQTGGMPTVAPPAARPGLPPPGATFPQKMDETHFIAKYLRDNQLPNTADNVAKARAAFTSGGSIGREQADKYAAQIADLVGPTGVNIAGYRVTPEMTKAEANEALAAARNERNEFEKVQAPERAQGRKDERTYGYAEDPKGVLMLTNKAQADKWGHQFMEVSKADQYKDAVAMGQLNDIVLNTTRLEQAVRKLPKSISTIHAQNMAAILNEDKIKTGTTLGWFGRFDLPGGDYIADVLKDTDKAHLWNDGLTKEERDVMSAYIRAKSSAIMYQRAAGSITRLPGDLLKLELDNLPAPYVGWTASEPRFRDWKENIDQLTKRFPHNIPGVEHPSAVRERVETGGAPQGTAAPAGKPKSMAEFRQQQKQKQAAPGGPQ